MHDTIAPLQVGLNVVGTLGVTGAFFAAGNLVGRRRRAMHPRQRSSAPRAVDTQGDARADGPREAPSSEPTLHENPAERRFEIRIDGELVGVAEYRDSDDVLTLYHTEISPLYRGRGLAGTLIEFALDASRRSGRVVEPVCPYVRTFIDKHPQYRDLLASARGSSQGADGCCALPS